MEERELIGKAREGNKSALNTLLTDNYGIVKGYVIKMTGDPHTAQDVVQETMLRAVLHIGRFSPEAKFSTWLITIATNVYRDILRKNKRLEPADEKMESTGPGPEEEAIINMEYHELMAVLKELPHEKRAVFILKHYYGYKYEEIAQILDCPIGTVRSRLHFAIKYIISELEKRRVI